MIGVDIVEIRRISELRRIYKERFLKKILSEEEISLYCRHKMRDTFLAGRFAAKEAVIKAYGHYIPFNKIEILGSDKPFVRINGKNNKIMVSISHTEGVAIAVAIISLSPFHPLQQ